MKGYKFCSANLLAEAISTGDIVEVERSGQIGHVAATSLWSASCTKSGNYINVHSNLKILICTLDSNFQF